MWYVTKQNMAAYVWYYNTPTALTEVKNISSHEVTGIAQSTYIWNGFARRSVSSAEVGDSLERQKLLKQRNKNIKPCSLRECTEQYNTHIKTFYVSYNRIHIHTGKYICKYAHV